VCIDTTATCGYLAIHEPGQIEQLCASVYFSPEAMLQSLLGVFQGFVLFEVVQVRENTHNFREAVHLQNIQELERLHLKPKTRVNHQKNEVRNFRQILDIKVSTQDSVRTRRTVMEFRSLLHS
jgi:hypothetical protein